MDSSFAAVVPSRDDQFYFYYVIRLAGKHRKVHQSACKRKNCRCRVIKIDRYSLYYQMYVLRYAVGLCIFLYIFDGLVSDQYKS